jgi:hypothetical protein
MEITPLDVVYRLQFDSGEPRVCELRVDQTRSSATPPEWAKLAFCQCSNCPLDPGEVDYCPFALALAKPLAVLAARNSYDPVQVHVLWRGRTLLQATTLQRVLSSIIGLLGATSGCPHTRILEPMAHFHQPFSQGDETLFRVLGTYLIGQLLRDKQGLSADFSLAQLADHYKQLRQVNQGLARRLRHASAADQSVNGLVLLDILAAETQDLLDDLDESLRPIFTAYL